MIMRIGVRPGSARRRTGQVGSLIVAMIAGSVSAAIADGGGMGDGDSRLRSELHNPTLVQAQPVRPRPTDPATVIARDQPIDVMRRRRRSGR